MTTLKEYRESKGLTQAMLAEMLGCDQSSVHRYENYTQTPVPAIMRRIKEVTGGAVTADSFYEPLPNHRRTCGKNTTEQQVKGL